MNPDRLHTAGLLLSNGRKPEKDGGNKYVDRYGRTERERENQEQKQR